MWYVIKIHSTNTCLSELIIFQVLIFSIFPLLKNVCYSIYVGKQKHIYDFFVQNLVLYLFYAGTFWSLYVPQNVIYHEQSISDKYYSLVDFRQCCYLEQRWPWSFITFPQTNLKWNPTDTQLYWGTGEKDLKKGSCSCKILIS